jgi:hypothetical protein
MPKKPSEKTLDLSQGQKRFSLGGTSRPMKNIYSPCPQRLSGEKRKHEIQGYDLLFSM